MDGNNSNTGPSENILWSNSNIQMWSTSKELKIGYFMKAGPTEKFLWNKRSIQVSALQLKIKNQIMAYCWTFKKDPLKLHILWTIQN